MVVIRKPRERTAARALRRAGDPIKRIAATVGVSPSSVFAWTRDIELSAAQNERNLGGRLGPQNPDRLRKRAEAIRRTAQLRRLSYQAEGRDPARRGDVLRLAGCMLYWAEGSKERNALVFCNSDVAMVRFFKRFLSESLLVPDDRMSLLPHVYLGNGLDLEAIEERWLALGARTRPAQSARPPDQPSPVVEPAKSRAQASIWRRHPEGARHEGGPARLRCDPGVRGLR